MITMKIINSNILQKKSVSFPLDALLTYHFIYCGYPFFLLIQHGVHASPPGMLLRGANMSGSDSRAEERPFIFIVPLIVIGFLKEVKLS